ncbi:MAG: hypothetical protein WC657_03850 [Candidatus Paceibacterota bacterium]
MVELLGNGFVRALLFYNFMRGVDDDTPIWKVCYGRGFPTVTRNDDAQPGSNPGA